MDTMEQLLDAQRASEELALGQGRERFDRRLAAAQDRKDGASFGAARRLLSDGTAATIEGIEAWLEQYDGVRGRPHAALAWIKLAGAEQAAYITMLAVLNHIYGRARASAVAREISDRIALEFRARAMKDQAPGLFNYKLPRLQASTSLRHIKFSLAQAMDYAGVEVEEMTEYQRVQVGMALLDIARQATDLFEMETQPVRKGRRVHQETYIWPTEDTQEWLARRNEVLAAASIRFRPMVVPPLDWDLGERGGYLYGLRGAVPLVTTWDDRHAEEVENASMPKVYAAINQMQRTPWRINQRVLAVVEQIMEQGGGHYDESERRLVSKASVPALTPVPMPNRPHDIDTDDEVRRAWRREAAYRKEIENTERQSKVRSFWRTIGIAREYVRHVPFFFPWTLDFRGRLYPVTDGGLSPQGDDLSRGLLQFAYGRPLGTQAAADALAMHGASCLDEWAGIKVGTLTRQRRLDLIDSISTRIQLWAEDPFGDTGWMEADKPLMFLAFCFEWAGYLRDGLAFQSSIPVHVDGSCNGIQHMAAIMRDEHTAEAVNVTANATPQDLYSRMAEYAEEKLGEYAVMHPDADTRKLAALWLDSGLVNRKACKRPTMTFGYGGTQYGFADQLGAHFKDSGDASRLVEHFHIKPEERSHYGAALRLLARVVYEGLAEVVPGAFQIREWLQGLASEACTNGALLLKWTVRDTGFPVYQRYNTTRQLRVKTTLSGGTVIRPVVREVLPNVDTRKHRNGIAPNYIHSLDAAHLVLTAGCMEGAPINAVHDSFGAHAASVPHLEECLRASFVSLYTGDVARDLRVDLNGSEKAPYTGDLVLTDVMDSDYFFV